MRFSFAFWTILWFDKMTVQRFLIAAAIFLVLLGLVLLPTLLQLCRALSRGGASGVGIVVGSPAENVFRAVVLVLLLIAAYWVSGKLVRQ